MTKNNTYINKQTNAQETHRPAPCFPSEVTTMLKGMKKHEDKEHGKTLKHEASRSINHKATQNKNNTGRMVSSKTTGWGWRCVCVGGGGG